MAVDICHKGQHEFLFFGHVAHGILVPQPGIKLLLPAVKAQILNNWTTREFPSSNNLGVVNRGIAQTESMAEIMI